MKWFGREAGIRSFAEDTAGLSGLAASYRGIHSIPVNRILGSVGRAHELRPNFMPITRPHGDFRFRTIRDLMENGEGLPPIDVYKLHDCYYVVDGNHRVAAARKLGQLDLDAVVTEYRPVVTAQAA